MILRRIIESLKNQDIGTLIAEVLVVVVGIFIGLQVDDWNQTRKDRVAEHDYLIRLQQEVLATIDDMQTTDRRIEDIRQAGVLILSTLETGTLSPQDQERFDYGMTSLGNINPILWRQMTLDELKSTGNLAILSDQELRSLFSNAESQYEHSNKVIAKMEMNIVQIRSAYVRRFEIDPDGGRPIYNISMLSKDEEFRRIVSHIMAYSGTTVFFRRQFMERMIALKKRLEILIS